MVKLNGRAVDSDREHHNKQWDKLMNDVKQGRVDQQMAAYLMERLNCIDKFMMAQGRK